MSRLSIGLGSSRRGVVLAMAAALALSAACGGGKQASQQAASSGTGTSPSVAEATVAGSTLGGPSGAAAALAVTAATTTAAGGGVAGSPAAQASGAAIDLCSLLTVEEAKAALGGREMAPPVRGQYVAAGSCHYRPQAAPLEVIVWLNSDASAAAARRAFDAEQRFDNAEAVAGVGDAAYVTTKLSKTIVVLSGARRLHILIQPPSRATDEEVRASLTTLGRAAAARLP